MTEKGHFAAPSFPIIFSIGLAVFVKPDGTAKAAAGTAALRTFFTIDVLVEVISLPARFTFVVVICFIGNPLMAPASVAINLSTASTPVRNPRICRKFVKSDETLSVHQTYVASCMRWASD